MDDDEADRPLRKKQPRSFEGCLRCKRLKVKCDESKPKCTRCLRAQLPCEYRRRKTWLFEAKSPGLSLDQVASLSQLNLHAELEAYLGAFFGPIDASLYFGCHKWIPLSLQLANRTPALADALGALALGRLSFQLANVHLEHESRKLYTRAIKVIQQSIYAPNHQWSVQTLAAIQCLRYCGVVCGASPDEVSTHGGGIVAYLEEGYRQGQFRHPADRSSDASLVRSIAQEAMTSLFYFTEPSTAISWCPRHLDSKMFHIARAVAPFNPADAGHVGMLYHLRNNVQGIKLARRIARLHSAADLAGEVEQIECIILRNHGQQREKFLSSQRRLDEVPDSYLMLRLVSENLLRMVASDQARQLVEALQGQDLGLHPQIRYLASDGYRRQLAQVIRYYSTVFARDQSALSMSFSHVLFWEMLAPSKLSGFQLLHEDLGVDEFVEKSGMYFARSVDQEVLGQCRAQSEAIWALTISLVGQMESVWVDGAA